MSAPAGARLLALQFQLEQSQWWPPESLRRRQFGQLECLLTHAFETVPFWRERLRGAGWEPRAAFDEETFRRLPVLTRREVQAAGEALRSTGVPPEHGRVTDGWTSGSTGTPIHFFQTEASKLFWLAFTLREHLWRRRDFSGKLAAIRVKMKNGSWPSWGPPVDTVFPTGPGASLDIGTPVEEQLSWLIAQDPDYLIGQPSNLRELALASRRHARKPGRLREVRTLGEVLPDDLRQLCREVWGAPVTDIYSTMEIGYLALQCPQHEHYHVQEEGVLVEVLDERGEPCAPGAVGRVVVTALHNFAMPLLRYEIGDYAEVGKSCPCGRGLRVLTRILGRRRNMAVLPDGSRRWPYFSNRISNWCSIRAIRQIQLVQTGREEVEARVVAHAPLTAEDEKLLGEVVAESLGYPFAVSLRYLDQIPRNPGNKFEEFMSLAEN